MLDCYITTLLYKFMNFKTKILYRERGGGHWVHQHPPGYVVGSTDSHLSRLRRLRADNSDGQDSRLNVRGVRRVGHGPPHPHRRRQFRRLLLRAEED